MIYESDLKLLCNYPNGVYCMGTEIRCVERGLSFMLHISHKGRENAPLMNWAVMHENLSLWGSGFDIPNIRRHAISYYENGSCETFYVMKALFPKEGKCRA